MANRRAQGQILAGFWAHEEFVKLIDEAAGHDAERRSDFLRRAIACYLRSRGIIVPSGIEAAPDRKGKGGPKPRKLSLERERLSSLNSEGLEKAVVAAESHRIGRIGRKRESLRPGSRAKPPMPSAQ
jgi:hypothetical protein